MPRVTAAYRDARRQHLLDAARRCFVRDGFHGTSMQDLLAESGMSAGAFYGYFTSKDELILAIAEQNLDRVAGTFVDVAGRDPDAPLEDLLVETFTLITAEHEAHHLAALAVQVWAEAMRNESLRLRFATLVDDLHGHLVERLLAHEDGARAAEADRLAALLLTIIPGFIVQLALRGERAVDTLPASVRDLLAPRER